MGKGVVALQQHAQKADDFGAQALEMPMVDEKFHDAQAWGPAPARAPQKHHQILTNLIKTKS